VPLVNAGDPGFRLPAPGVDFSIQIDNKHPGSGAFTTKTARVTEVIRVDFDEAYDAMLSLLGYSYVVPAIGAAPAHLVRVPPLRHPFFTWLFCTAVTDARGVQFSGRTFWNVDGALPAEADYSQFELHCTFEPLPYAPIPDAQAARDGSGNIEEYARYVSYQYGFKTESLLRPAGSLRWAETGSNGPQAGTNFAGDFSSMVSKADLFLTWHQVPEEFIVDADSDEILPTQLLAQNGTVNLTEFLGFAPGTLLLLAPRIERYPAPLLATGTWDFLYYCDVTFPLVYFNPPQGAASPIGAGWNTCPFFSPAATQLDYYYVSTGGSNGFGGAAGSSIYKATEFADLFTFAG
jgi:hypothetical protein